MLSSLSDYFNLKTFVSIVVVYIILIFYMKDLKKKFKHETTLELITFCRYILMLFPCFLFMLFMVYLYFDLGSDFLSRGSYVLFVMITYLMITFIIALFLKKSLKVMSKLSNNYLILLPIINMILNVIYITNQYFDFFKELDIVGKYFSLLRLDDDSNFISHFIFGYLMLESFVVLIYVMFVINIEDERVLKFICSDRSNKLDRKCMSEIIQDIFTYTMFIKFIACVTFIVLMKYIKSQKKLFSENETSNVDDN